MMESFERYIIKDNNTLVGNASILKSARKIVESGDVMMVPLFAMEDVTEEASTSHIREGWHEEPIIAEDLESSFSDQEQDSNTGSSSDRDGKSEENVKLDVYDGNPEECSGSDEASEENIRVDCNDNQEKEKTSNQLRNSPMVFALPVEELNSNGAKARVKCMLCNSVILKRGFSKHINRVHTSMHMRSVHFGEKHNKKGRNVTRVNCEECGARMLRGNLRRHQRTVHSIEAQD